MTIKTQQRVLLAVIGIIFCIMFGLVVQSYRITEQHQVRILLLNNIIKEVFDFSITAADYSMYHHDRALEQMELRITSLSKQLQELNVLSGDRLADRESMLQELERARHTYKHLKDSHNTFKTKYGVEINEKIDVFAHQSIENLSEKLSINAVALVTSSQHLLKTSTESRIKDLEFYDRLVIAGMVISFALLVTAVFLFSRRLVNSINVIKYGAARIASGDMASRINLSGSDELTDLSRFLNDVSEKLQVSYEALEDEIEERKRTEE